ncbi:hypothetical protein B0H34DRAFT_727121 [Crassisporium funariophilum]|nr:hypothetical protein B0H34DRAFT_727121 [Crassisporium funariophilum]
MAGSVNLSLGNPPTSNLPANMFGRLVSAHFLLLAVQSFTIAVKLDTTGATTTTPPTSTTSPSPGVIAPHYAQCGGGSGGWWSGPTVCEEPYTCQIRSDFVSDRALVHYSSCLLMCFSTV